MKLKLWPQRFLIVQRDRFTLTFWYRPPIAVEFEPRRAYPIAVGTIGFETPRGLYVCHEKAKDPDWQVPDSSWAIDLGLEPGTIVRGGDPANPIRERWIGVTPPNEGVGIHGTFALDSLGKRASHGCVRMAPDDVIELYGLVPKGTPIFII